MKRKETKAERYKKTRPLMTFMEMVRRKIVTWNDIDDFIDLWHKTDTGCSLHEYLGMSWEEYSLWLENPELAYHIEYV